MVSRHIDANENQYTILNKTGVEKKGVWEDVINKTPTADLVEVVRCEDCIYEEECGREVLVNQYDNDKVVDITGFLFGCSHGERADT